MADSRTPARPDAHANWRPEFREELTRHSSSTDRYAFDEARRPDGISYEWKRITVYNNEDKQHQVNLHRNWWRPVPASRHPELSGTSSGDGPIVIDGLMLMERPKYLTDAAHKEDEDNAFRQLRDQEERVDLIAGIGPDADKHKPRSRIDRSFERFVPPDEDKS